MKNKDINSKKERIEDTWSFPPTPSTKEQERELAARVAEIGLRAIFENFTYTFGGNTYKQSKGGPSG